MAILVTGGAGYIGSHTCVALADAGFDVIIVDNLCNSDIKSVNRTQSLINSTIPFHEVDICDEVKLSGVFESASANSTPITAVIHFAALKSVGESVQKPELYHSNNIGGTETLLKVMAQNGVHSIVFSSSCTVYGQPSQIPVDENAPFLPAESPYGMTKQACEKLIVDHSSQHTDFSGALLRYFNPIGAHPSAVIGESPRGVPNNLIPYLCSVVAGLRPALTVFGTDYPTQDGSCIRDYLHVCDLADAHVAALRHLAPGICRSYNLGTGRGTSVLEIIYAFETATGQSVPHVLGERREGDIVSIWADPSRAESELSWKAVRSLEEALQDAWRWQQTL
jgi:UDP-glucose 4-epimerase